MSTTPHTVLYWWFWNFACVYFMVWGCALGLDIIVRASFPHCELKSPSIYRQWVHLVSATPLTVLQLSVWNFACVFFMVREYTCGLDIIVRSFFFSFFLLWTVILHPQYIDRLTVTNSCERNFSYCFVQIILNFCLCFLHGMRMCMWFGYNC